eukprot:UN02050
MRYEQLKNQQIGKSFAAASTPPPQRQQQHSGKKSLSEHMAPAVEEHQKNNLTGVPLTDFDTMFKNSRLSNLFTHEQSHNSFGLV